MNFITKRETYLFIALIFFGINAIGMLCNFTVMVSNKGLMPVYQIDSVGNSTQHFKFTNPEEINYFIFSDRFIIDIGKEYHLFFSIGDLLMYIGGIGAIIFLLIFLTKCWKDFFKYRRLYVWVREKENANM